MAKISSKTIEKLQEIIRNKEQLTDYDCRLVLILLTAHYSVQYNYGDSEDSKGGLHYFKELHSNLPQSVKQILDQE